MIAKAIGEFGLLGPSSWGQRAHVPLHEGEIALQKTVAVVVPGATTGEVGESGGDVSTEKIEVLVEAEGGELGVEGEKGGVEGVQKWEKKGVGKGEKKGGEGVGKSGLREGVGGVVHA